MLYAVVGWRYAYLHSLMDIGFRNKPGVPPVLSYTKIFRQLRGAVHRKFGNDDIPSNSASALWCTQIAHQTQLYPTPSEGWLIIAGNFSTRHVLVSKLLLLSDRNCHVLGTLRLKNVDSRNKPAVEEVVEALKKAERGKQLLCRVQNAPTEETERTVAKNCGYLAFRRDELWFCKQMALQALHSFEFMGLANMWLNVSTVWHHYIVGWEVRL